MFPDGWTAAGLCNAVLPGSANRTVIHEFDIVIWRGEDGIVRAWENRCPHRGMRLSYGMVRGNRLTCLYHGWTYDGNGGCAAIPAHPDLQPPKTIQTVKFACREEAGMIWVRGNEVPDSGLLPTGTWTPCRSLHLCSTGGATNDLLDRLIGKNASRQDDVWAVMQSEEMGGELLLALQPMGGHGAMLHIAVAGDAGAEQLQKVSRWISDQRNAIETVQAA